MNRIWLILNVSILFTKKILIGHQNSFKKRRLFFENLENVFIKVQEEKHLLRTSMVQCIVKSTKWNINTKK